MFVLDKGKVRIVTLQVCVSIVEACRSFSSLLKSYEVLSDCSSVDILNIFWSHAHERLLVCMV